MINLYRKHKLNRLKVELAGLESVGHLYETMRIEKFEHFDVVTKHLIEVAKLKEQIRQLEEEIK